MEEFINSIEDPMNSIGSIEGLSDLEPYNIDIDSEVNNGYDNGKHVDPEVKKKNYPFIKIFEKYFVKSNKNLEKSQAMKIFVFIQANLDPFFNKGLIVLPVVKIVSADFLGANNDLPSFNWKDSKEFWLYGWDQFNKFISFLSTALNSGDKEFKDEIKNLNENVNKTLSVFKASNSRAITISINDITNKKTVRCTFSPFEINDLINLYKLVVNVCSNVLSGIILNKIYDK